MVSSTKTKLYKVSGGRHSINLRKDFVEDSSFPFEVGELLSLSISGKKVIIKSAASEEMNNEQ